MAFPTKECIRSAEWEMRMLQKRQKLKKRPPTPNAIEFATLAVEKAVNRLSFAVFAFGSAEDFRAAVLGHIDRGNIPRYQLSEWAAMIADLRKATQQAARITDCGRGDKWNGARWMRNGKEVAGQYDDGV